MAREFSFILARFNYLLLTTSGDGYRFCLVNDDKAGELMRTSFNGFKIQVNTPEHVKFDCRYDYPYANGKVHFINLDLHYDKDPGERTNRSINYGHWKLTISGHGYRFDDLKKLLLKSRAEELWSTRESLVFRGAVASDEWDSDYLHQ